MAVIVVGGQTKHVGKTTMVCEIIRHFVSAHWTAVKITSHSHEPQECAPVVSGSGWTIWEQSASDSHVDTTRYLEAGAVRSLLVSTESESLASACAALKAEVSAKENAIVESTAGAELLAPDLFLLLVNPGSEEIKASAREQLARAHALIVSAEGHTSSAVEYPEHIPTFSMVTNGIDVRLAKMIDELLRKTYILSFNKIPPFGLVHGDSGRFKADCVKVSALIIQHRLKPPVLGTLFEGRSSQCCRPPGRFWRTRCSGQDRTGDREILQ